METTAIRSLRRLKALYTFCRAPANMWDLHELTIAKLSKEMHDKLDDMRLQHDASNQASSHFALLPEVMPKITLAVNVANSAFHPFGIDKLSSDQLHRMCADRTIW